METRSPKIKYLPGHMIRTLVFVISLDSLPITSDFNFFSIRPQFDIQSRIHSMYVSLTK